ncbi:MAG: hypothetical protein R6X34_01425, partial [Chloroflexota bacterium]
MSHFDRWKKTIVLSLLAPPLGYYAERMYQSLPALTQNNAACARPRAHVGVRTQPTQRCPRSPSLCRPATKRTIC